MHTTRKKYYPYVGLYDPCPPLRVRTYETPPQLYMGFQPYQLPQFSPREALKHGTLWPALYAPYDNPYEDSLLSVPMMHFREEKEKEKEGEQDG